MIKLSVDSSMIKLFYQAIGRIDDRLKELEENSNIARNLACSELGSHFLSGDQISAARLYPERTDLLEKNFALFREEISFHYYLTLKAFKPHLPKWTPLDPDWTEAYDYWHHKLKNASTSEEFELADRFVDKPVKSTKKVTKKVQKKVTKKALFK